MKSEIKGIKAAGDKVEAEILFLGSGEIGIIGLTNEIRHKIIVGQKFSRAALMKAITIEVAGIITADISEELFAELEQGRLWEIGESLSLKIPLLVVDKETLALLQKHHGKKAVLDPKEKQLSCL